MPHQKAICLRQVTADPSVSLCNTFLPTPRAEIQLKASQRDEFLSLLLRGGGKGKRGFSGLHEA